MTTARKRLSATIALVTALALTPVLSGCAGNPIEGIIEGVTGGQVDLGGPGMPKDFPREQVPVVDGEVIHGGGIGNEDAKIWNLTVRVSGPEVMEQIKAQFEASGFEAYDAQVVNQGDSATAGFRSQEYAVLVVVSRDDSGFVANYTVTRLGQ